MKICFSTLGNCFLQLSPLRYFRPK